METEIAALMARIRGLEEELEAAMAQRRAELRHGLENGKAVFEEEVRRRHLELRQGLAAYLINAGWLVRLTSPVIYACIIPFVLLDLFVTLYQAVCFPVGRRVGGF